MLTATERESVVRVAARLSSALYELRSTVLQLQSDVVSLQDTGLSKDEIIEELERWADALERGPEWRTYERAVASARAASDLVIEKHHDPAVRRAFQENASSGYLESPKPIVRSGITNPSAWWTTRAAFLPPLPEDAPAPAPSPAPAGSFSAFDVFEDAGGAQEEVAAMGARRRHELNYQEYGQQIPASQVLRGDVLRMLQSDTVFVYPKMDRWGVEIRGDEKAARKVGLLVQKSFIPKSKIASSTVWLGDSGGLVFYNQAFGSGTVWIDPPAAKVKGPSISDHKHRIEMRAQEVFGYKSARVVGNEKEGYKLVIKPKTPETKRLGEMQVGYAPALDMLGTMLEERIEKLATEQTAESKERGSARTKTDPSLWTTRHVFGVAGGPDEIVLTDEGLLRAFSVGSKVRRGGPAEALEALSDLHGDGYLSVRDGARMKQTDLGRFDQIAWGHLRALGLVESFQDEHGDGVRLTESGKQAVMSGLEERSRLLARCRKEALSP